VQRKLSFFILLACFVLFFQKFSLAGKLVTIETQKAHLTLLLVKKLLLLEGNLSKHIKRHHHKYKILVIAPQTYSAFQDQRLVNETVIEFLKQDPSFQFKVARSSKEALRLIKKEHFDLLYIAGITPNLERIIHLAHQKRIITVSHLTELVYKGVAISLDLDRAEACILANERTWKLFNLTLPEKLVKKICFVR